MGTSADLSRRALEALAARSISVAVSPSPICGGSSDLKPVIRLTSF
jgi:hypothetical protein